MKEVFKATVKKLPDGLQAEAQARSFKIMLDEPKELGGTDKAMNPVEAILCALGGCQTICAYAFAGMNGIKLNNFYVELEGDLDPDGFQGKNPNVRNGFSEIRFKMHFDTDAPQDKVEEFAKFIEAHCPVGDNLGNGVPLVCSGVVID